MQWIVEGVLIIAMAFIVVSIAAYWIDHFKE